MSVSVYACADHNTYQGDNFLAAKGTKAADNCVRVLRNFTEITIKTDLFKMFYVQIQQMFVYGSEVWGLQRSGVMEKFHTFACKQFCNVPLKTPNT